MSRRGQLSEYPTRCEEECVRSADKPIVDEVDSDSTIYCKLKFHIHIYNGIKLTFRTLLPRI